ncbi:N-acetylglucosamine-6-phosphate deacetylase [Halopolyspora algeriensis]|uniref:N-acetylglucosamine-6-phosphate deacetylase n=1 Tax=Halopolyspora algeriensis TaxID=1500506 RepID=A0A368VYM4_9ACTN|nr:N-acetylglucosamine-6-phosphate deacetylase [Halopolyspora algeriensis]RCW47087.1 N-acetylglucosamine-6-phosphate deacetylase [Halopolyspora algeriensis]TQM48174.1 N-acetylglucosamine-6-phosphate deacetylase [Halopolyspora algeriensis]
MTAYTAPAGPGAAGALTLTGGHLVTPRGPVDGWVHISDGIVIEIGTGSPPDTPATDVGGHWIVPGFVDIHCHGGGGGSFTSPDPHQVRAAVATHRAHGTTTMLASLVTASVPDLVSQIGALREQVSDGLLAGIHLEGPFLSAARCGAHDPSLLRPPDRRAIDRILTAGRGTVRMMTLAPELDGAIPAVGHLTDHGVLAAVGHTDAVLEQVIPAVEAGATVATHLFNGMPPLHHRAPGPVGALLADERVTIELICDLVHLHPTAARLAAQQAGAGRTVAITDAISATAAGDGTYELGPLAVTVTEGAPRLADGSLAGSTLTMDAALRNLVTGCGLPITEAVLACSTTPAALLGLSGSVGALQPGLAADLVVLDADLRPRRIMKDGSWVPGTGG